MKTKFLTVLFVLGLFICMLDTTIMNVSLPTISNALHVGLDDMSWALNVYLILFAALTIPLTRLAEVYGIQKGFLLGVILFGVGSIVSAAAPALNILLIGRAIQSIGAAIIFPLAMTLAIGLVNDDHRTGMIGILGITQGIAGALGPTIGGIVTQFFGWRWIFLINVSLVIIMLVLGMTYLTLKHEVQHKQRLDVWGAILSIIFLSSLSIGLIQGRVWGWHAWLTITCFGLSSMSFILFLIVEQRSVNPMVPLQLFKNRVFSISAIIIILSNLFLVATTVILPTYFTSIAGFDALHASLLVAPISLAIFIFSPISGFAQAIIQPKWLLTLGFLIMTCGYLWLANGALVNQTQTILSGTMVGMGYGLIAGPILVIAAGSLHGKLLTASQSVTSVLRQVGAMLAVAIFITSLYGNLALSKKQSQSYAESSINKLAIPSEQKTTMIGKIAHKSHDDHFIQTDTTALPREISDSIKDIEIHTTVLLWSSFEKLYAISVPFLLMCAVLSLFLKEKQPL